MQLAFSPRAQFTALTVGSAIAISLANAQGPAPSPFLPQGAQVPSKDAARRTQPSQPPALTREDLEPFLDALIPSQLQNRNIAGAVVAVVKDDQVLLEKGYGYSDFSMKL
jgi:CubicO group peptidase (beta-lactamase class C family)